MNILNKKLLKLVEGAEIEKISISSSDRKLKIKTNRGTISVNFFDVYQQEGLDYSAETNAEVAFKATPTIAPTPKVMPAQKTAIWPFPTGNKP